MLLIRSPYTNPWFNLAAEEYLLKNSQEDIYFQYIDQPSVVVGKHQNSLAEINYKHIRQHNILVARRLTGGGTVYHDEGNLNFSFIMNGMEGSLVDFRRFILPIHESLTALGLRSRIGERNDILIDDMKISGNAEHVFKRRTLHHGTLLFNTGLETLRYAIHTEGRYTDKAVPSRRSPVTNISTHLSAEMNMQEFDDYIASQIKNKFPAIVSYNFSNDELQKINDLVKTRYATWEWIYAYSPDYTMEKNVCAREIDLNITLEVKKGSITALSLQGQDKFQVFLSKLEGLWTGLQLQEDALLHVLSSSVLSEKENQTAKDLVPELF